MSNLNYEFQPSPSRSLGGVFGSFGPSLTSLDHDIIDELSFELDLCTLFTENAYLTHGRNREATFDYLYPLRGPLNSLDR